MKKLYILTLVVAVAVMFASPAMATKSRLTAMGGVDNYIEDDYNIFNWPATLPSYANIMVIELINDDYRHYGVGPYFTNGYSDAGWYGNSVSAMFGPSPFTRRGWRTASSPTGPGASSSSAIG